jgi:SAM-dependent methyltransferase
MRLPFWINYFDYAFNFFTSFGYFNTRREHHNAIRTISESLKPGGVFIIDYFNVHFEEDNLEPEIKLEIEDVNYHITKWFDETHFYKKIKIENDQLKQSLTYFEKVAKFSLGDFTEMLSYHKMQVQEVFGDYNFNHYDIRKSPRMIIVAHKMVGKS